MAGSKKWFVYTTDNGDSFAKELDESNTEAINGTTGDFEAGTTLIYALPQNITPRSAFYVNADETRTIRCVALTPAIYNQLATSNQTIDDPLNPGQTLTLKRIRPETIRLPFAVDTGQTDGDAT